MLDALEIVELDEGIAVGLDLLDGAVLFVAAVDLEVFVEHRKFQVFDGAVGRGESGFVVGCAMSWSASGGW